MLCRRFAVFRGEVISSLMTRSRTLQTIEVKCIVSVYAPVLSTGVTKALLQLSGMIPMKI